jgi:hypothetical protein
MGHQWQQQVSASTDVSVDFERGNHAVFAGEDAELSSRLQIEVIEYCLRT